MGRLGGDPRQQRARPARRGDRRGRRREHGAASLQRHGGGDYRLPHLIDHAANLRSLVERGCDRVLAIGSVGSLQRRARRRQPRLPRRLHRPAARRSRPSTTPAATRCRASTPPGASEVLAAWAASGAAPLRDGGVYWQTIGPRFETPAEIRLIAAHADLVGMTIASECIVAGELGLAYAAICVVDNLANGIGAAPLGVDGAGGRPRGQRRPPARRASTRCCRELGAVGSA